jgi:predicted lipoprotein with Yx(FWY)xxD motif
MSHFRRGVLALCIAAAAASAWVRNAAAAERLTPPGIGVRATDLDGTVYVDAKGRTLYVAPRDEEGASRCDDTRYVKATRTISSISYYLADADRRRTCVESWPPLLASERDKPVDDWTVIQRPDGLRQWAFRGKAVYRSILDQAPGDVNGHTTGPSGRQGYMPLTRSLGLPPGITTRMTQWGRVLAPGEGSGILYVQDGAPQAQRASCDVVCRSTWKPVLAPAGIEVKGDWSAVSTGRGVQQWAYRGQALFAAARLRESIHDPPMEAQGWLPAVYRPRPAAPSDITVTTTAAGRVYADRQGRTVYFFSCVEETVDHQFCDVLGTTPMTRLAMCGGPEKCMRTWRPVLVSRKAHSANRTWTIVKVDPKTGARIGDSRPDGLSVWAYRGRPLYTYYLDQEPGDAYGYGIENRGSFQVDIINLEFQTADTEIN